MILDLEGPDGLLQLTFCSEEGGRAALHTEALLLPVFPLLAKLQLLSSGLFPVLKALKRWWGPALLVGSTQVQEPGSILPPPTLCPISESRVGRP